MKAHLTAKLLGRDREFVWSDRFQLYRGRVGLVTFDLLEIDGEWRVKAYLGADDTPELALASLGRVLAELQSGDAP